MRNRIIDIKRVVGAVEEPLLLTEVKEHLNITTTDYDTELTNLIKRCRRYVENYCNISIVETTVTMVADLHEEWELPYGPVVSIVSVKTRTATEGSGLPTYETLNTWAVDGEEFQSFSGSPCERHKIIYTAGYTSVPEDLKNGILNEIAFRFKNKGDNSGEVRSESAIDLIMPYKRMLWI